MPSFTIGRYNVQDSPNMNCEIQGLSWGIDSNNIITMSWTWPKDISFKMALVFDIEKSDDTLETLLRRDDNPDIITKSMGKYYNRTIDSEKKQFKVFPARFGEGSEIIVMEQKNNNTTDILLKKIRLDYNITYQPIMFSDYQKVIINIEPCEEQIPNSVIYEKYANNTLICRYPLENTLSDSFFYIKKHENIKIKALEPYKDILEIKTK